MPKLLPVVLTALLAGALATGCAHRPPPAPPRPAKVIVPPGPEDQAMAARIDRLFAAGEFPGLEAINWVRTDWVRNVYLQLKGERPATAEQLAKARETVAASVARGESGLTWPAPAEFRVPRTSKAPKIDGLLDDEAWHKARQFSAEYRFNEPTPLAEPRATWYLTWDELYLYAAVTVRDRQIVAPELPRDGAVWSHDCIELFILPAKRTGSYWELVIGPTGALFDALHGKHWTQWGAAMRFGENLDGLRHATRVRGTPNQHDDEDEGYTVELAIPFAGLPEYSRAKPAVGQTLHFMLAHLDQNADGKMDTLAFQPLLSWGHNIWCHARLTLAE